MHEHEIGRRIESLEAAVLALQDTVRGILRYLRTHRAPPAAPTLAAFFQSGDSMNAVLVATLPTSRQDGTPLAITDIASISYQKTSLTGSPPVAGPNVVLQTNAASGTPPQLQTSDLTFTDPNAAPGDSYTAFVTDTLGHIGAASSPPLVAPAAASPPAAPTLSATFT
jgi:hypothetical protein